MTDSWPGDSALMASCLPAINKAAVAAAAGPENAGAEAGELVADVLRSWAPANLAARAAGVPTVGVGHGTVVGSINEQGVPMAGLDHEFTTGALLAAECDVFALGHIHQHQGWWSDDGRAIAYAGSVGRLHFGELSAKGFIAWTIEDGVIETRFHETPAKTLIEFEFDGPPDMGTFMEYLESKKKLVEGAHVRVKFTIDEEFRYEVDKAAIEDLFIEFGAEVVKIVGTINPVQRTRAAGITESDSIETKLAKWAEVTDCDPGPLLERLAKLQTCDEQDYRKLLEPPLPAPEEKAEEAATPAPETRHEFGAAGGTSVAV